MCPLETLPLFSVCSSVLKWWFTYVFSYAHFSVITCICFNLKLALLSHHTNGFVHHLRMRQLKQAMFVPRYGIQIFLAGCAVRGGGEGASLESLWEERDAQHDGAARADPQRHQQTCGAAAVRALHQRAATDRPAAAQTSPVSSAQFPLCLSQYSHVKQLQRQVYYSIQFQRASASLSYWKPRTRLMRTSVGIIFIFHYVLQWYRKTHWM